MIMKIEEATTVEDIERAAQKELDIFSLDKNTYRIKWFEYRVRVRQRVLTRLGELGLPAPEQDVLP